MVKINVVVQEVYFISFVTKSWIHVRHLDGISLNKQRRCLNFTLFGQQYLGNHFQRTNDKSSFYHAGNVQDSSDYQGIRHALDGSWFCHKTSEDTCYLCMR